MDEFAQKESLLQSNKNGFFLSKNVGLYHYKHRYDEWKNIELDKERKRKTFSGLIEDTRATDRHDNDTHYSSSRHSTSYDQHSSNSSHHSSYNSRNKEYDNGHHLNNHFKKPRSSPYFNKSSKY